MSNDEITKPGVEPIEVPDLLEQAAEDPCMPIRNLAGHFIMCNYGDWPDFGKCECEVGIVSIPEKPAAVVIAPMPLRDIFAKDTHISDDQAIRLAEEIKLRGNITDGNKDAIRALVGSSEPIDLSVSEIAHARSRLRYLEADMMINWRAESTRLANEARAKAKIKAAE